MNKRELIDLRNKKVDELESIKSKIKIENREMNEDENDNFLSVENEIRKIKKQIEDIDSDDKKSEVFNSEKNNKEKMSTNFSFRSAINDAMYGTFSDESLQYVTRNLKDRNAFSMPLDYRATIASDTSDATGGYAVSKDYWNILEPLQANIAVTQMGAQFLTGLQGDLIMPTYSGTAAYWKGETIAAVDGAGDFGQVQFTPKKLTASFVVSKQFIAQDTVGTENMLRNQAIVAISEKLDSTILGNAVHSADAPDGFFTTGFTFVSTSAATYAKIVALESSVNNSKALKGSLGYVIHPTLKGTLKTTQKFTNAGLGILDGGELNGYKCVDTSNIANNLSTAAGVTGGTYTGVVFGNWADYVVAQWGNLDISVNPWLYDAEGLIRVTITGFFDAKPLRNESFAVGALA